MATATDQPDCGRCGRPAAEHRSEGGVDVLPSAPLPWPVHATTPVVVVPSADPPPTPSDCPGYEAPYGLKDNREAQRLGYVSRRPR